MFPLVGKLIGGAGFPWVLAAGAVATAGLLFWRVESLNESLGAAEAKAAQWERATKEALLVAERQRTYSILAEKKAAEVAAGRRHLNNQLQTVLQKLHEARDAQDNLPDTFGDAFDRMREQFWSRPSRDPASKDGVSKPSGGTGRPGAAPGPKRKEPRRSDLVQPSRPGMEAMRAAGQ